MSREIEEKIRETEHEAKVIAEHAEREKAMLIKNVSTKLEEEKAQLLKKLKREHNERILRCELQWQKKQEEAQMQARIVTEEWETKYNSYFEEAVLAAMKVILEDGDIKNV